MFTFTLDKDTMCLTDTLGQEWTFLTARTRTVFESPCGEYVAKGGYTNKVGCSPKNPNGERYIYNELSAAQQSATEWETWWAATDGQKEFLVPCVGFYMGDDYAFVVQVKVTPIYLDWPDDALSDFYKLIENRGLIIYDRCADQVGILKDGSLAVIDYGDADFLDGLGLPI